MNIADKDRGRHKEEKDLNTIAKEQVMKDCKLTSGQKSWLLSILRILKNGEYVRVLADNCLIDIMDVAYTPSYVGSFYDVYYNLNRFVTTVSPIKIKKIENDWHNLAGFELF